MIYVLIPYHPSSASSGCDLQCDHCPLNRCLHLQTEPYKILCLDSQKRELLWAECMQWFYVKICNDLSILDDDIICMMNTDLEFDKKLFSTVVKKIKQGTVLIPRVYENEVLVDGGIEIDWTKKSFKVGERIDCFSPRGIFITAKDFRESGGYKPALLPHYLSDYDWSIRQIKRGIKACRVNGVF